MTQIYLTMPKPGETITEGLVVSWMMPVGSCVKEGEAVVELETEKALFEYESPYEGTLIKILANPQSTVAVGEPIAILDVSADKAKAYESLGLGQMVKDETCVKGASKVAAAVPSQSDTDLSSRGFTTGSSAILLSPYIRRLLQENNLKVQDLKGLVGHGPNGRPTKEDVEGFIATLPGPPLQREGSINYEDVPLSPIRLRIAQNMLLSLHTIPHAHAGVDVDMTRLLDVRQILKQDFKLKKNIDLKLMPLIFMALKEAIVQAPIVNARLIETPENKAIRFFKNINLGMALGTAQGLLTPVIKNCELMSFMDFAQAYDELIHKSETKHLKPADFEGATIAFNNFGAFGLDVGIQIIPPGLACVIGMGAIRGTPAMARFFLAFDHRLMDGREAGIFLTKLKKFIENFTEVDLI